jgi:Peptidase family M1 domain
MKQTLLYTLLVLSTFSFAQFPSNNYQSANNHYYWKNRKPHDAYWQQDVHYTINADLDDKKNIISGNIELVYYNNSPDALDFVYFHLYSNAQAKGSYLSDLYKINNQKNKFGKYQQQGLGTKVDAMLQNGLELKTEEDNTIIKVYLSKPLKSGESTKLTYSFKTYYDSGSIRNRMKLFDAWGYKHYDVVHWYPRISVYDHKFGWDTEQHMDHEFYGDFGTYDVAFTLPNNYVLDATGTLLNRKEVLPDELRAKLDITNFKTKKWNEKPSEIIAPDGSTKTWKYHAENVHDFALTADPTYRIGEVLIKIKDDTGKEKTVQCISLAQEPHAARWQNAATYAAKVITVNSRDFGPYGYEKMIVADAQDGMEYPMLTLDGGGDPDYRGLLAHEISHNWFFGMVGNNETYRAALDEGFTQFLTSWNHEKLEGKYRTRYSSSKYAQQFTEPELARNGTVYNGYLNDAAKGNETFMCAHSDMYAGATGHAGGYRQVYMKTATMLYNLQYTLGDSLFLAAMSNYFNQWKFAHPYIEDFRNSIIQYTHVDLNWFFDEWMETSKTIDYAVKCIKKGKEKGEYKITFKRKGMQMPLDFAVLDKNDSVYNYHIPNNWFVKNTSATVLPRWIGWDNVKKEYTATVKLNDKLKDVILDTSKRMADVYMLDNKKRLPLHFRFDSKVYNPTDWTKYEVNARPELWYNGFDGIKAGVHVNGSYMNYKHIFDLTFWFNSGIAQNFLDTLTQRTGKNAFNVASVRFNYRTATDRFMKGSAVYLSAKQLDGLRAYTIGFDRKDNTGKNKVFMYFKSMYRQGFFDLSYLLLPTEWTPNQLNNTVNVGLEHIYNYLRGQGNITLSLRSSALMSDYDYQSINLTAINKNKLGRFAFNTRVIAQYGTGSNWAKESSLFLAGANPEELMENKYTRSIGFFDPSWASYGATTNYFQQGGGLNLRGYAGYFAPETTDNNNYVYTYRGQSGAAVNAELEFSDLVRIKKQNWLTRTFKLTTYLFGDAGVINYQVKENDVFRLGKLRADAGVGAALTIKKFGALQLVNPLTIRVDMPFFLNQIPAKDRGYIQQRFVFGINRTF